MNYLDNVPSIVGGGSALLITLGIIARKFFVNWSKENVVVQGADTTAAMMANFHTEIKRLADSNAALAASNADFARENADLRKQISRLEAILEKIAVKFDIDLKEFSDH